MIKINSIPLNNQPKVVRTVNGSKLVCPYQLLHPYLEVRVPYIDNNESFFVFRDRIPVKAVQFRKILKAAVADCGLDCSLYDTHSLCTGHSIDLCRLGIKLRMICNLGRWHSNAVFSYLKNL